ncbi:hypothetical protein UCRPA7_8172 [Phaeoacremonium minimum UCRPA7]|uniref:Uncharacterized protein n=1 Tax=Phaeoacremonium minimum (strain UCR-PA7) TaxID=1286976 RepID=R8BAS3_PHAM7|nr:hypothetical protein UCRPA7_8172 [Phaeoacremonium minimum UCRPA7]EON96381.1 hypothetical protein UCRPA7_8172 [Phaeoacremonium minimum UCRPA7]
MFEDANCTHAPAKTPSNAGIAGTGVLLSFIITAVLALLISVSLIIQDSFFKSSKPSTIRRKLLNSYSDQQILTGIGIQAVGLAQLDTLVPYHFFIIWMLSLLSMAVHNATLLALVGEFKRDWVLRWLRQFLMFVNLILSAIYGIFMLQVVQKDIETSTLPVACVWGIDGNGSASNAGLSYVGTIAVIAGNCIVFAASTWYLHYRKQRFFKLAQLIGWVLMTAIAVGATVRVILLSQAFGKPTTPLSDKGETVWSFGSLISLLMLLLPLMSLLEIARGEVQIAPPVMDDKEPLLDTEMAPYQPNPFFRKK